MNRSKPLASKQLRFSQPHPRNACSICHTHFQDGQLSLGALGHLGIPARPNAQRHGRRIVSR